MDMTFFQTPICCKICNVCLKRPGLDHFLKNTRCVCSSCSTKYLSPLIVLGLGVTFLTLILPSHTKAIAWMRQQKTEVLVEKNTLKWGRLRVTTLTILLLTKHGIFLH